MGQGILYRVSDEQYQLIARIAKQERRSLANFTKSIVLSYIENMEAEAESD